MGKPEAQLHHADRGSQYTSEQFQRSMADHGVVCSLNRSGNVWDNAAMESFFSSLTTSSFDLARLQMNAWTWRAASSNRL